VGWSSLFLDSSYEIRSGWKFTAYGVLLVCFFLGTGTILGGAALWLHPEWIKLPRADMRLLGLNAAVLFASAMGALLFMARLVDRAPIVVFGAALHDGWLRDVAVGVGVAGGMLGVTLAGSFLFGKVDIEWSGSTASLPSIALTLAVLIVSAANEELIFRGYPFQVLMKGLGPWGAILLLSSLFGFVHLNNQGATSLSTLNTALAGVLLSLAYLKTRSIWLPFGIHIGWNAGTAVLLGLPMSGIQTASLLSTHVSGPQAILGGGYGPEDGVLGSIVFVTAALAVLRMRVGVSPQMNLALAEHSGKVWIGKHD